jgi:uncharacterized protein YkwD
VLLAVAAVAALLPALLSPTTVTAGVDDLDAQELAAVERINEIRGQLGLQPFTISPILTETAEWMVQDLAERDLLDHTDSLGRGLRDRFNAFSYPSNTFIRENLAAGYQTGAAVVVGWQNSPGHRANNEADDVVTVGIARVYDADSTYGWFWVLTFGSYEDPGTITVDGTVVVPLPVPTPPIGTGEGTFSSAFPSSGVGLNVWNGGTIAQLTAAAEQGGARSIFVTVDGQLVGYVIGAPTFVNAAFSVAFPGGTVDAGTVVLVVV